MRNIILAAILALIPTQAFAQRQVEYPRFKITFDGSTTVESGDTDGFWVWRTSSVTPAVSGAGTARIYFDGTNFRISENGGAYRVIGAGTVTSVGLTLPASVFAVTGSPVTGSGTLTATYQNQTGNTIFASPSGGGAGAPTFRNLVTADYGTGTVTSTSISNGTILFADWNQNSCATGNIPKWNGSAWACAGDDTSPGGTSWLTSGNTLGNSTSWIGSIDSNPFYVKTNNTIKGTFQVNGDLDWENRLNFVSGTANYRAINGGSNIGAAIGFIELANRTSTLPTGAGSLSYIIMDNGKLKVNEAGTGWQNLVYVPPTNKTLIQWTALQGEPPATDYATFDTRNNHPVLDFDDTTVESIFFSGIIPEEYDGGTITVRLSWTTTSATSSNVVFAAQFERMLGIDIDADSFGGTEQTVTCAVSSPAGTVGVCFMTFTQVQAANIVAGDPFRLKIRRVANSGSDLATGDAELLSVQIRR